MRRAPREVCGSVLAALTLTMAVQIAQSAMYPCGTSDTACLIAAITAANLTPEPDTIRLAPGTYVLTTVDNTTDGPNGLPSVTTPITLQGVTASQTVITRAPSAPGFRVLHVASTGALTVQGLALTGGGNHIGGGGIWNEGTLVLTDSRVADNGADVGGGLVNRGGQVTIERSEFVSNGSTHMGGGLHTDTGGTVTIHRSTFTENGADGGATISNDGSTVLITNSAIVDNIGHFSGTGGITNRGVLRMTNTTMARNRLINNIGGGSAALSVYDGDVLLTNCTIVDNTASDGFGGISRSAGVLVLQNTTVARNTGYLGVTGDCRGLITSQGHNLIGDPTGCTIALQPSDLTGDPGLDAYLDDGQPGHGHYPLLATSQAVDAGNPFTCPLMDQLGRPRSGLCDLGAVEFQPVLPPALTLTLNQLQFRTGETVRVALHIQQPGPTITGDFYFGALLPDGQTALFLSNAGWVQARLDNPRAFRPLATHAVLAQGLDLTFDPFFTYTFHGAEAPGVYTIFALFTPSDAFDDNRIDAGDLLALDLTSLRFSPSALVAPLPANVQAIRDRHLHK